MQINTSQWRHLVRHQAALAGIDISSRALEQIALFASELLVWNEKINLTTLTAPEALSEKHMIDSLIPARFIPENASVLDLGSGGGFPGIPLKIFKPSLDVVMVDSIRKKINFLKYVISQLKFDNIAARQLRVEQLAEIPEFAGRFDVVISRAFTSFEKFFQWSVPLIQPKGIIIAMKGRGVDGEIQALKARQLGSGCYKIDNNLFKLQVEKYQLPVSGDERALVICRPHVDNEF